METLHIYRFTYEHATLVIEECPGRWCVLVRMEGRIDGYEQYSTALTVEQWHRLCAFRPFNGIDAAGPLAAILFSEHFYGDVLELSETESRHTVQLRMWPRLSPDPDEYLTVTMTEAEWMQLTELSVLDSKLLAPLGCPAPPDDCGGTLQ